MKEILKGKVVGGTVTCGFLSGRERSSSGLRSSSYGLLGRKGCSTGDSSYGSSSRNGGSSGYGRHDTIGTDVVEPTTLILVGVNIEGHGIVLTHLNVKLFDTVFTEDTEETLTGILARNFNNIVL